MKHLLFSLILITSALQASNKNAAAVPMNVDASAAGQPDFTGLFESAANGGGASGDYQVMGNVLYRKGLNGNLTAVWRKPAAAVVVPMNVDATEDGDDVTMTDATSASASASASAAGNAAAPQAPADVKAFADIKAAAQALGGTARWVADSGVSANPQNLTEALKAPYGADFASIQKQPIEKLLKAGHRAQKQHVLQAFRSLRWDIVLMLVNAGGPLEALDDVAIHYHGGFINNPNVYRALETLVGVARGKNQLFLATRLQRHVEDMQQRHSYLFPELHAAAHALMDLSKHSAAPGGPKA